MYAGTCRISPFHHPEQPRHTAFAAVGLSPPLFPGRHGTGFPLCKAHIAKSCSVLPETDRLSLNAADFVRPHRVGSFFFPCKQWACPRCRGPPASEIR